MRFIADIMVGSIAKYPWVECYDVVYLNDAYDDLILQIARNEDRIVLTRDTMMLKRREFKNSILRSVFILDDALLTQLLQVKYELDLVLKPDLIVCLVCNNPLKKVEKKDIKNKVPPYVYKTQSKFKHCSSCGRYYWRGTHYDYIKNYFSRLNRD